MPKLFILDDDENLLFSMYYWFEKKGFEVKTFSDPQMLLACLQTEKPGFILLDVYLAKGEHGGELCYHLKEVLGIPCPVYLFSGNLLTYDQFCGFKADGFILKRTSLTELFKIISSYIPDESTPISTQG